MSYKVLLVTLLFAIPTFLTGHLIWPPDPMGPAPTAQQLPFFILLSICEGITFGLGMSFLIFGWPYVQKVTGKNRTLTMLTFVAIFWSLVSWWPHDNLHTHIGMNLQKLLYLEYGFHVTLMIAAIIIGYSFLRFTLNPKK